VRDLGDSRRRWEALLVGTPRFIDFGG